MSVKAITWAFEQPIDNPNTKFVLVCIADTTDDHGISFPGIGKMVKKTSLSRSTIIRAIKELEKDGYLQKAHRITGSDRFTTNAYKLPFVEGCIDDHPLSGLFENAPSVTETPPSVTETPPSVTETPPSVTVTPLKPSPNHHLNQNIYIPLTREEFLREIDGSFKAGAFSDEFGHLTESEIMLSGGECFDYMATELKEPRKGKGDLHLKRFLRHGMKIGKVRKASPESPVKQAQRYTSQDHMRVKTYLSNGFWRDEWGEKPDNPACKIDPVILSEFNINHNQEHRACTQ